MPGRNMLFIPGPTNMPDEVRLAMDIPLEDQRAPDFPAFTLGLFQDVKKIFKTRNGQVFLFPASGTHVAGEASAKNAAVPAPKAPAAHPAVTVAMPPLDFTAAMRRVEAEYYDAA